MVWRQPTDLVLTKSIILKRVDSLAEIDDRIKDIVKAKLPGEYVLYDLERVSMNGPFFQTG